MNSKTLLTAAVLSVFFFGAVGGASVAFAQYLGNTGTDGKAGAGSIEEILEIQARRIAAAEANPGSGSGTPYLDANGVVGASVIAGAVFGGIAAAFFIRGRSGRYAAMGRG